jgi:hypothetical protein
VLWLPHLFKLLLPGLLAGLMIVQLERHQFGLAFVSGCLALGFTVAIFGCFEVLSTERRSTEPVKQRLRTFNW